MLFMRDKKEDPTSIPDMHWVMLSGNEHDFDNAPK